MKQLSQELLMDIKLSMTRRYNEQFALHLPNKSFYHYSFFHWYKTPEDLKAGLFNVLLASDPDHLAIDGEARYNRLESMVFSIFESAQDSDQIFFELNEKFIELGITLNLKQEHSFCGELSNLLKDTSPFSINIRASFRKNFYGINFESDLDIGVKPISMLEAIKFQEYLIYPLDFIQQ